MSRDNHIRLRIPDDLKNWIKESAERNMRSMTAEINFALRERMQQRGAQFADQAPAALINQGIGASSDE